MGQLVGIAIVWFIIEMLVWYLIAQFISGWWVFLWLIVAIFIGAKMIKSSFAMLNPLAQQMQSSGMMNTAAKPSQTSMFKKLAFAIAGFLLIVPGVISDVIALIVLLPPVQKKLADMANNYVNKNPQKIMEMMASRMGGQNPFGGMGAPNGQNPFGNNPFGANDPFGSNSPFGTQNPFDNTNASNGSNPFGSVFKTTTTVDGTAKSVKKEQKKLTKPANDE